MSRPSSIDRLPPDMRELIGSLRREGRTIDEIMSKLRELAADVSRSALGRHVKELDAIVAEIQRTRTIASAIVEKFGDASESKTARLNIELMHGLVMKLMTQGEDGGPVKLDAQEAYFTATALQRLAQASKADVEREVQIRKQLVDKLDKQLGKIEDEARSAENGLPAERIAQLRREFLGVKS
jgi:hypothetical protein